jgi:hypothetical protein|tara:strand:+ start:960 stop:1583 length:624 start_codon:yes stop_codon:yes gene_type:complete
MANKTLTTPKGSANWVKVFTPDTKYQPEGEYSMKLIVREDLAEDTCNELDALTDAIYKKSIKDNPKLKDKLTKRTPYERVLDDEGNETGEIEFKFKTKARITAKDGATYTNKVAVFDSKATPITEEVRIGNGSTMKVTFEPISYMMQSTKQASVSLRLKSTQLIDLVEYGSANTFGEEEGYTFEPTPEIINDEKESSGDSTEEDEDF